MFLSVVDTILILFVTTFCATLVTLYLRRSAHPVTRVLSGSNPRMSPQCTSALHWPIVVLAGTMSAQFLR